MQTQSKGNIKAPRHWPLCGEFTGTGEFPAQRASYAENVSIWWRHHDEAPFEKYLNARRAYIDLAKPVGKRSIPSDDEMVSAYKGINGYIS